MTKLRCHSVCFYSPADEACFFQFIKQIKAIQRTEGLGEDLFLHIKIPVSEKSLRDLIGLFRRYKIDLSELNQLKNKKNAGIFDSIIK
jgi:hypothetical protein